MPDLHFQMISIKDNIGFIVGFGTGAVVTFVIGKFALGFRISDRRTEDSDIESDGK